MDLIIRPMAAQDAEKKGYVHWTAWQETYAGLIDAHYLANRTLARCVENARRWPDHCLLAEMDGEVVGFAQYGRYQDDSQDDCGELHALYVLRGFQRQGIGYALMNAAMDAMRAHARVALWVLAGNRRAIQFYRQYGFHADGATKVIDLGRPVTEIRMVYSNAGGDADG